MRGSSTAPTRPHRILMATDLSAQCDRALDRAVQLAGQWQAPLLVVHATPRDPAALWPGEDEPALRHSVDPLALIRQRIRRDLRGDVADVDIHVQAGDPAEVILDVARREHCDLIVLGDARDTRGRNALGDTVEALLRKSPVSLLIVKQRPRGAYRRVLVGTDFTVESRHGLTAAAGWFPLADFTLLHALDIPYKSHWLEPQHRGDLTRMEMATIEAFVAEAGLPADLRQGMQLLVEHGHPEAMLGKRALEHDNELTVIGAFRCGLAFHLLVGGTTRRIVQAVPNDVLVVRVPALPDAVPPQAQGSS